MLAWLLEQPEDIRANYDPGFSDVLCWFLHAEGSDQYIWDWIELESKGRKTSSVRFNRNGVRQIWVPQSQSLLAGLVCAHLDWNVDGTPDSAFDMFFRAVDTFLVRGHARPRTPVSLVAARAVLGRHLLFDRPRGVRYPTVARFDRFAATTRDIDSSDDQYCALLMKIHPEHPDPKPWVRYITDLVNSASFAQIQKESRLRHLGGATLRAAHLLRVMGCDVDASDMDNLVKQAFPTAWAVRYVTTRACQRPLSHVPAFCERNARVSMAAYAG